MDVYQKDVMGALVGAAGATSGFGLGFVGVAAGLLSLHTQMWPQLKRSTIAAMIAFIGAIFSTFLAFLWLVISATSSTAGILGPLYWSAIVLYILSLLVFVVIFVKFTIELRSADIWRMLHTVLKRLVRDLGQELQPPADH